MEFRANGLRDCVVGGVPDEHVPEAVRLVVRQLRRLRPHELLSHERDEAAGHLRLRVGERLHGAAMEDTPLDGAALEHISFSGFELVEPSGEHCLDRRRHADFIVRRLADEGNHLLEKKRIPFSGRDDALAELALDAAERVEQLVGLDGVERLQQDGRCIELAAAPARPSVEQFRAREVELYDLWGKVKHVRGFDFVGVSAVRLPLDGSASFGTERARVAIFHPRAVARKKLPRIGRARASRSSSLRNAHAISSAEVAAFDSPSSERSGVATVSSAGSGPSCLTSSTRGQ